METPPSYQRIAVPKGQDVDMVRAGDFPLWYFLTMYDAVGQDFLWEDMHLAKRDDVQDFVSDERVEMHTMMREGYPQGFFLLDRRHDGICDIAYFGLVKEAMGKGLGGYLLDQALMAGWEDENVVKMTVNTCTLDHPHARSLYESRGFSYIRSETRTRRPMRSKLAQRKDEEC